jgi:hypothetical protein
MRANWVFAFPVLNQLVWRAGAALHGLGGTMFWVSRPMLHMSYVASILLIFLISVLVLRPVHGDWPPRNFRRYIIALALSVCSWGVMELELQYTTRA